MSVSDDGEDQGGLFNPEHVNLDTASQRDIACYTALRRLVDERKGLPEYMTYKVFIAFIFIMLFGTMLTTLAPVYMVRTRKSRVSQGVLLYARHTGGGMMIATAMTHLLNSAYGVLGPHSCIGMTGRWATYSWPPAIVMASMMFFFLLELGAETYLENRQTQGDGDADGITGGPYSHQSHANLHSGDQDVVGLSRNKRSIIPISCRDIPLESFNNNRQQQSPSPAASSDNTAIKAPAASYLSFRSQSVSFVVLESGTLLRSMIIGATINASNWGNIAILFPIFIVHQAFEGMCLGARLVHVDFPRRLRWLPWVCGITYAVTAPVMIGIAWGIGLFVTYSDILQFSIGAAVMSAITAGCLLYTGLVQILARDFLFNPERTRQKGKGVLMVYSFFVGMFVVSLVSKAS
ncbi:Zinc/iron permease [Podospora australis]|uniref:Zinc/iron permease n=1 Tax=Podospora australis TaxID=1536484 RepID=A0AAN6WVC5_9PEZI|nr:Zinc/iron permease [Podospora australis]